jgi:hypothetical protein
MFNKESREARVGELGEDIVDGYVTKKLGYHVYKKVDDGAHPIDRIALHFNSGKQDFRYDVKTKKYWAKLNASGFNLHSFNTYEKLDTPDNPVAVFFVDVGTGNIYGNWLKKLKAPLTRGGTTFPKVINGSTGRVILFPLENMKTFWDLTPEEIKELKSVK